MYPKKTKKDDSKEIPLRAELKLEYEKNEKLKRENDSLRAELALKRDVNLAELRDKLELCVQKYNATLPHLHKLREDYSKLMERFGTVGKWGNFRLADEKVFELLEELAASLNKSMHPIVSQLLTESLQIIQGRLQRSS